MSSHEPFDNTRGAGAATGLGGEGEAGAGGERAPWTEPALEELPPLDEVVLGSPEEIEGGGNIGDSFF